ncbi:PD-(D/E)XK nuclease family protein [Candidatus Woesearchaeota archaeon]|nr:PD-(D/E)XK nuclease family protein [Candidatus Woesearchaeota archaeon]
MPYKFSPSSLSLIKECPRCFWLRFNKDIKRPEGIFPSLPNGMDNILKAHFDSFIDNDSLPPELSNINGNTKLFDNAKKLEEWRNNKKGIRWEDESGNIFMGAVDNLLKKGNKLIVLDYKTRGYPLKEDTPEHYKDQLDIYNLLLRKNGFETEDYSYLLFYHPTSVDEKGSIVFHTDLIKVAVSTENAENIFKKALQILKEKIPEAPENCGFCKWAKECKIEK